MIEIVKGIYAAEPMAPTQDGGSDSGQIEDAWWAALAVALLHPVQVQIIEALGWTDEPLSAFDLAEIVDTRLQGSQLVHHLRRLDRIDAIEVAERPTLRNATIIRFRLSSKGVRP